MKHLLVIALLFVMLPLGFDSAAAEEVVVYKSRTCGCCKQWIKHLEASGFSVQANDVPNVGPYKAKHGVPPPLSSCHTATVGGYVIEGHVPAADIRRLLNERPKVVGLTVPGMPEGSPGMEGPHPQHYDVLTFDADGRVAVFSRH